MENRNELASSYNEISFILSGECVLSGEPVFDAWCLLAVGF